MKLHIKNLGRIFSGKNEPEYRNESSIIINDGVIDSIQSDPSDSIGADLTLDASGATAVPGLIDSHCHVVLGDYTPRQRTVGFLSSYVHGGITRCVSPGELHTPGRPRDREGVKSLAITASHSYNNIRPGGMKVHGGSVVLEPTLKPKDFEELRKEGVWLAKAGFGAFDHPGQYRPLVEAAQKNGFMVMVHTGGNSIPGSTALGADELLDMKPDVCGHINGGPTALAEEENIRLIDESDFVLQLVQAGNLRSSLHILKEAEKRNELDRIIIGSDTPTGTGVIPLAMLKTIAELSSLSNLKPENVLRMATGNIAHHYDLEAGVLAENKPADITILDAPQGSVADSAMDSFSKGDIPAVSAVITGGELQVLKSRNTPPAKRPASVENYQGNPFENTTGH